MTLDDLIKVRWAIYELLKEKLVIKDLLSGSKITKLQVEALEIVQKAIEEATPKPTPEPTSEPLAKEE